MSNKKLSISIHIILGIALIAALSAIGYYRSKYLEIKNQPIKVVTKTIVSQDEEVEIKYLKNQIAELKEKAGQETVVKEKPTSPPAHQPKGKPKFSLLDLKETDPERYQKIMEHYTKMNERMSKGVEDKMVFFNDLDTTGMTDEELANHQKLLEKLAKMHEATEKARVSNNADDIQQTMRSQWQNYRELSN